MVICFTFPLKEQDKALHTLLKKNLQAKRRRDLYKNPFLTHQPSYALEKGLES
ncbi:hypothetical protein Y015_04645 [Chlamydia muridarum str. Nigg CM972]|nr:hypothetical protein TAC_04645 [Chlamydia muridarum str. Nigg3 CMUT3-5]AHH24190.1 hypothetical protein Y015_04645 [Chlamydia muridarum str. Nigg CM972]